MAFWGVLYSSPLPETVDVNRLNAYQGAEINYVIPGSSADIMGIKEGDVILELNGVPIDYFMDLKPEVVRNFHGDPVSSLVRRNGEDLEINGTFGGVSQFPELKEPKWRDIAFDYAARRRAQQRRHSQEDKALQEIALQDIRDELAAIANELKDDPHAQGAERLQTVGEWHLVYVIDKNNN